jgi:hypothetical protein
LLAFFVSTDFQLSLENSLLEDWSTAQIETAQKSAQKENCNCSTQFEQLIK